MTVLDGSNPGLVWRDADGAPVAEMSIWDVEWSVDAHAVQASLSEATPGVDRHGFIALAEVWTE